MEVSVLVIEPVVEPTSSAQSAEFRQEMKHTKTALDEREEIQLLELTHSVY